MQCCLVAIAYDLFLSLPLVIGMYVIYSLSIFALGTCPVYVAYYMLAFQ